MAGSKQQKTMFLIVRDITERLHCRIVWTLEVYIISKSHVNTLLEEISVLYYLNTETFPVAQKVPKLQKVLTARRLYHRDVAVCLPCKGLFLWPLWQAGQWARWMVWCVSETDGVTERWGLLPLLLKLV